MVSVDDHTTNAIEMISETAVLTETVLLKLFEALNAFLGKNKDKDISNQLLSDKTKDGKQKIKDLIEKHQDGVVALDENLTKAQVNDYQKELKKLGVDFSVVKNDDKTHSFFFAASQANIIEKALKNVVEKKTAVLEKPAVKETEKELAEIKQALEPEQVKSTKELYDKVSDLPIDKPIPKDIDKKLEGLSDKEKALYAKLEEVDTLKKGLYSQEVDRVENLFSEKKGIRKEPQLEAKSQTLDKLDKDDAKTIVHKGFQKSSTHYDKEDEKFHHFNGTDKALRISKEPNKDGSFTIEARKYSEERNPSAWKEVNSFSKENAKGIVDNNKEFVASLTPEERELFKQKVAERTERLNSPTASVEADKYKEMAKNANPKSVEKIENLYKQNADKNLDVAKDNAEFAITDKLKEKGVDLSKINPETIKEKVNQTLEKAKDKLAEKGFIIKGNEKKIEAAEKKMDFTVNSVKEKTKEIKEQDKEQDKDKTKKKELSR